METQIKNNGTVFYPLKKLAIGVILFASFFIINYYVGGVDGLTQIKHSLRDGVLNSLPNTAKSLILDLFGIAFGIYMVYAFASGLYRIFTFGQYIPQFEDKSAGGVAVKGSGVYPNINRILSYRESKLSGMSPDEGANLYISSSKLDSLYTGYNAGPETMRTLSYIESKLNGMSPDRGLNYLANRL